MQIDFHHAVTYVVSRYAGFGHREADIVAYCAAYVDDATNHGTITFKNGAMYTRMSSAHKTLDYRNFQDLANHHVWIPFHFLPGNGGKRAGENPEGSFIQKIICSPNSHVAQDMLRSCIVNKHELYGLHRLGICMHVFADTWAHQRFAGVIHKENDIAKISENVEGEEKNDSIFSKLGNFFGDLFDETSSKLVGDALPLGHGAALSYPDLPYLKWSYKDYSGTKVERDNTMIFIEAADEMCKAMRRYRVGDPEAVVPGLDDFEKDRLYRFFRRFDYEEADRRHERWINLIQAGELGFPGARLDYIHKGENSWKHQAIGTTKYKDDDDDIFDYHPSFLGSDWKQFHDALMVYSSDIVRNILPRYGICTA